MHLTDTYLSLMYCSIVLKARVSGFMLGSGGWELNLHRLEISPQNHFFYFLSVHNQKFKGND